MRKVAKQYSGMGTFAFTPGCIVTGARPAARGLGFADERAALAAPGASNGMVPTVTKHIQVRECDAQLGMVRSANLHRLVLVSTAMHL